MKIFNSKLFRLHCCRWITWSNYNFTFGTIDHRVFFSVRFRKSRCICNVWVIDTWFDTEKFTFSGMGEEANRIVQKHSCRKRTKPWVCRPLWILKSFAQAWSITRIFEYNSKVWSLNCYKTSLSQWENLIKICGFACGQLIGQRLASTSATQKTIVIALYSVAAEDWAGRIDKQGA